jgi:signal transduction histidine kinase
MTTESVRRARPIGASVLSERSMFHAAIGVAIAILAALTTVTLLPGERLSISNGYLDVGLNTLTSVVAAGAAALAWARYWIEADTSAVYECAAFLVLFATRLLIVWIAAFGQPDTIGMGIDSPQQWPLYAWSFARLISALLLGVAATTTLRNTPARPLPVLFVLLGPLVVLAVVFIGLMSVDPTLPAFLGPQGLAALRGDPTAAPGMTPLGLAAQAVVGIMYIAAAVQYYRIARDPRRAYARYLTLALIVAAFSQVHWAMFPGIYRPLVTVDDLLRTLFSVILLVGIGAQFQSDLRALRAANVSLRTLRSADVERAALETRARIAREIHDGLSQDLWLAKLKQARLAQVEGLSPEARELVGEVGFAVDRALGSARAVIETMTAISSGRTLEEAIQRTVRTFETESGIRVDLAPLDTLPKLDEPAREEIVRILREALLNIQKHADATVVRVSTQLANRGAGFELRVTDNGHGFDPGTVGPKAFGLRGMHERALLLGGEVDVTSRPTDGTTVSIRVPARAVAGRAAS